MSVKRIVLCYENRAGKLHEITDMWIDDYSYPEMLIEDVTEALDEFLDTEGVFHAKDDDPDADD
jgi:hypothetical protein